jgi:recombination protein RecT
MVTKIEEHIKQNQTLQSLIEGKMGKAEFVAAANQLMQNEDIMKCSPDSVLGCLLNAAILGLKLSPTLGECWIIKRRMKGADIATFQIGYKGWQTLAFRSGVVSHFDFNAVYENDRYDRQFGSSSYLNHTPAIGDRGRFLLVWASATTTSGLTVLDEQQYDTIERHRKQSDSQSSWNGNEKVKAERPVGVWATNYDIMAARIAIANICKRKLPKNELLNQAINMDGGATIVTNNEVKEVPVGEVEAAAALPEATEGNALLTLHDDFVVPIAAAKTPEAIRELFDQNVKTMNPETRRAYTALCTKAAIALQNKKGGTHE